jgi:hypothetical protein
MVSELIQIRTALSICDRTWKWTPLHYAAHGNHVEMVEMLLSRRASPYLVSEQGWTPLQCAINNKANECAAILSEFVFSEPAQNVIPGVPKTMCPKNVILFFLLCFFFFGKKKCMCLCILFFCTYICNNPSSLLRKFCVFCFCVLMFQFFMILILLIDLGRLPSSSRRALGHRSRFSSHLIHLQAGG